MSGGFFGKIGHALGSVGKFALPIVGGVLGGPLGGAAGGAISGLLSHGGASGAASGAALGGLGGYAMQGSSGGGAMSEDPGSGDTGGAGGIGGFVNAAGNFIKNNPALLLGGATAAIGAAQSAKAGGYQQQALDLAKQQYGDASPFRAAATADLAQAHTPRALPSMGSNPYLPQNATARLPIVGQSLAPGQSITRGTSTITNSGSNPLDLDKYFASPVVQAMNGGGGAMGMLGRLRGLGMSFGSDGTAPSGGRLPVVGGAPGSPAAPAVPSAPAAGGAPVSSMGAPLKRLQGLPIVGRAPGSSMGAPLQPAQPQVYA